MHGAALDVGHAAHPIEHDVVLEVVKERVDGEVATGRILVGLTEHVVRADQQVVAVVVLLLGRAPKRRRLDHLAATEENVNQPKAPANDAGVAEQPTHVVGTRARRHVEILGRDADEQVAHAAAHEVGLVARHFTSLRITLTASPGSICSSRSIG